MRTSRTEEYTERLEHSREIAFVMFILKIPDDVVLLKYWEFAQK